MAASVNKVILIGNLGADPEVKYTAQKGVAVCDLSVATNEVWKDKNGQKQEKVEWHRVKVWGDQAENCGKYLTKGRSVYVEGKLQTRKWEDKNGQNRYTTEIVAERVVFLGGGSGDGESRSSSRRGWGEDDQGNLPGTGGRAQHREEKYSPPPSMGDDDIPF